MADFILSRFCAVYTPDGGEPLTLTRHSNLLSAPPTREWSSTTAAHDRIGTRWGLDRPTGNARLVLTWRVFLRRNSTAALERALRRLEIRLNTARAGKLQLLEAYADNAPTMVTEWRAVVQTATPVTLTGVDAPPLPGAWGALDLSFTLTEPEEQT